jgi:hypothetical protein
MVGAGLMAGLMATMVAGADAQAAETRATVVYEDIATEIATARVDDAGLWVTTADLTRATRFELKPQGVCRDELCFPLPRERRAAFVHEEGGARWFDLTAFAALVQQPVARDVAASAWYFGLRADQRLGGGASSAGQAAAEEISLKAPNFILPDMAGKAHSLADFRGKKVLLVTWASW